ncbi:MAG: DUF433 domain-containing protein [Caldilineaceae bacterium]
MQIEDYFDFASPEQIQIKGHRILIDDVLHEYIHNAMTPDELAERFPTLTLEEIYATLLYYVRNKAEIDRYLTANLEYAHQCWLEQQAHPTPDMVRLRKIRAERKAQRIQNRITAANEQVAV